MLRTRRAPSDRRVGAQHSAEIPMLETTPNARRSAVRADDVDLFVRDWGEGRPIVFLSGWTLTSGMWSYQMAPLAREGFRCVAYDRRAHGRSGDPGTGFDFDTLSDDLAAVLDALDLHDVTVVAHSFSSGEIVRYLARHRARRVGRVLLLAPAALPCRVRRPDNPSGLEPEQIGALLAQLEDDFPGWIEANAEPYFGAGAPRALVDWTVHTMLQTSLLATVELTRIQMTTDFRDALARIDTPTLVIHGDRDASAPLEVTGRPAAELIPGARLVVYEGAPHGLYFTHRHRLNADIADFAGRTRNR
jgi:pimeloyl-ACP methyl ester carboxylesterase